MSETVVPTKAAKCVTCGKDITIGKFASLKTAFCDEHKADKPKPPPKPANTATAAALVSPAPAAATGAPVAPVAPPIAPVIPATALAVQPPKEPQASQELRQMFSSLVGRALKKDAAVLTAAGFKLSPHQVIYHEFESGKVMTFVELNGKCIGVAVTSGGQTNGYFDLSTIHGLAAQQCEVLAAFLKLGL